MNRQTKRILQRQGQVDGAPDRTADATADALAAASPAPSTSTSHRSESQRASLLARLAQYFREVRAELAKVLWPKRSEIVNYSTVVLTTLVFIALLIFGLNFLFARGVLFLFK